MATAEAEDIATQAEETQNMYAVELNLNDMAAEVVTQAEETQCMSADERLVSLVNHV